MPRVQSVSGDYSLRATMAGYCAAHIGRVGEDASYLAGVFNSAVTGVSSTAGFASILFVVIRTVTLCRKGTRVSRIYIASMFTSLLVQILAYCAMWGLRIWCPGIVTEVFCRSGLFVSSVAEAAASFSVLYVVSDRLTGVFVRAESSAGTGVRASGASATPTSSPTAACESVWRAGISVALFWGSSIIAGLPVVISDTVRTPPGMIPMCGIGGYDGVSHIIFHMTIVYVLPAALILTKNAGAQRFMGADAHWPFVRRVLVFYALHFILTMPMVVSKSIEYLFEGAPFSSAVGYYELVATVLYLFRLFNFASTLDLLEDGALQSEKPENGSREDVLRELQKPGGCCCRRCVARLTPRWLYGYLVKVVTRFVGRVRKVLRKVCRIIKGGDREEKGGLPFHDELSVTVTEKAEPTDDNKRGIDNPNYVDSDNDSGYAVEVISVKADGGSGDRGAEETELGERGEFVGGSEADTQEPRDWRPPALQHGVILYAAPDFPPEESVV